MSESNKTAAPRVTAPALVGVMAVALVGLFAVAALVQGALPGAKAQVPGLPPVFLGYCQLASIDASTGLAACAGGIPAGTNAVILRGEAQALRYRPDGATTAPTATVGMPMLVADPPLYVQSGTVALTAYRFISQTAGAKLNVTFLQASQ